MSHRKLPLAIIFLTVFVDLVGISIVIPVAAPLFLGSQSQLFAPHLSIFERMLLLGILLAVAPLIQFFSTPLLGAFSDRSGRKPIILFSILTTGIGHLLFGLAIITGQVWLLFASRVLAGAGAGNISAASSAVADLSPPEAKARNFGLVGTAIGLGIIFGPFLGGKLSDPSVFSWATLATPLWFAAGLSLVNALSVVIIFRETLRQRLHLPITALTGLRNLVRAFSLPNVRSLYIVSFLFSFGFNFFTQFFSVFLVAKFGFGTSQIGSLIAYVGLWLAFTQGILTRVISRSVPPEIVVRWAPLVAVATLWVLARVQHPQTTFWLLPVVAMSYGINPPNMTALISNAADRASQGEAMGINDSMGALAFGLPPVLAALASTINVGLPLILSGLFIFLAWVVFMRTQVIKQPSFHEI